MVHAFDCLTDDLDPPVGEGGRAVRAPAAKDAALFMELRFKSGAWETRGIPEEGCRIRLETLNRLLDGGGSYGVDDLIYGLMDWLDVTDDPEPANATLRLLVDRHYPTDGRVEGRCRFLDEYGMNRIFHVGPVNCDLPLVRWQRRDWLIALAQRSSEKTRMVVAAPGPISLKVALRILALSVVIDKGEPFDSFEGARATCHSPRSLICWEEGELTQIDWQDGQDGQEHGDKAQRYGQQPQLPESGWLAPNQLAMQVAIAAGYMA